MVSSSLCVVAFLPVVLSKSSLESALHLVENDLTDLEREAGEPPTDPPLWTTGKNTNIKIHADVHGDIQTFFNVQEAIGLFEFSDDFKAAAEDKDFQKFLKALDDWKTTAAVKGEHKLGCTGDFSNRGPYGLRILLILKEMQQRFPTHVYITLGNHEAEMLGGNFLSFVNCQDLSDYCSYLTTQAPKLLPDGVSCPRADNKYGVMEPDTEYKLQLGKQLLWSPAHELGRWLLKRPLVIETPDTVFMHGSFAFSYIHRLSKRVECEKCKTEGGPSLVNCLYDLWQNEGLEKLTTFLPAVIMQEGKATHLDAEAYSEKLANFKPALVYGKDTPINWRAYHPKDSKDGYNGQWKIKPPGISAEVDGKKVEDGLCDDYNQPGCQLDPDTTTCKEVTGLLTQLGKDYMVVGHEGDNRRTYAIDCGEKKMFDMDCAMSRWIRAFEFYPNMMGDTAMKDGMPQDTADVCKHGILSKKCTWCSKGAKESIGADVQNIRREPNSKASGAVSSPKHQDGSKHAAKVLGATGYEKRMFWAFWDNTKADDPLAAITLGAKEDGWVSKTLYTNTEDSPPSFQQTKAVVVAKDNASCELKKLAGEDNIQHFFTEVVFTGKLKEASQKCAAIMDIKQTKEAEDDEAHDAEGETL